MNERLEAKGNWKPVFVKECFESSENIMVLQFEFHTQVTNYLLGFRWFMRFCAFRIDK